MTEEVKKEEATEAAPETGVKKAPATFRQIIGEKRGMTQIYDTQGSLRAVTVIEAGPCAIYCVRTAEKDGYKAVQLGWGKRKEKNVAKAQLGQYKIAGQVAAKYLREFRIADTAGFAVGQVVDLESRFKALDYVDVHGVNKGKGFAGVMKRHNFRGMPASHGASDKERSPGSLASRRSLGRVLPGQRMAGHMGDVATTVQKIEVVHVDPIKNLIYVNGSVPGPAGSLVAVTETVKNRKARILRKVSTVMRDKMGNIIKQKESPKKAAAAAKPAEKK